jgi:hypothetical protein
MKAIHLLKIQNEAKKLQNTQNITYNQSLQIVAQQNGFKSYQAILDKIKKDYVHDENEQIKEFKLNVFENRKHIKSNFTKIEKLAEKHEKIRFTEEYDNDEEKREEILQEIEETASKLSNSIAKMFFGNIKYKGTDNEKYFVEGCAYAGYVSSDFLTFHNDIDAHQADYFIELYILDQSFSFGYRDFNIDKDKDIDNEGNEIIKEYKEWSDWYLVDIKLP